MDNICINIAEIKGRIGSVNRTQVSAQTAIRFSVCTEYAYKDDEGRQHVECTWHNCACWEKKGEDLSFLAKGNMVHLKGRIKQMKYTSIDEEVRYFTEIQVQEFIKD